MMDSEALRERVRAQMAAWLERFVVGMNLCPFARKPLAAGQVRIQVSEAVTPEALLEELQSELLMLDQTPATELETTLLVAPRMLQDFLDYNDFLHLANDLLEAFGWEGHFQIASFHPYYQFADTEVEDAENYTNRAPWPTLHVLREDRLEEAVDSHPDPEGIPGRNIDTMNRLGTDSLAEMLDACRQSGPGGRH